MLILDDLLRFITPVGVFVAVTTNSAPLTSTPHLCWRRDAYAHALCDQYARCALMAEMYR
jgi:hypothetical protein